MCGITGFFPRDAMDRAQIDRRVQAMTRALVHRGPDDEGFYISSAVGLGVRRLSIIDRAHGAQPMVSEDGSLVLVFNGEIYNYLELRRDLQQEGAVFHTESDTEVLLVMLERHGVEGVRRIEGMFSFALWNERTRELTLTRDWLGQKSLYWTETPGGLAFASEIKALLAMDGMAPRLNVRTLSHYMSMRYLPGQETLFEGIYKLPAAHTLRIEGGRRTLIEHWRSQYEPKLRLSEPEIIDRLDELMGAVIAEHLMSEVPLGAFLSGGIDSSLVVAYASQALGESLATFAIGADDESQRELPWAREVAERYRTRHTETIVQPDLARLTPRMIAALEEPVDPFAAGVYIVSEVARRHVTVALGGDGGDELFAGYDRYKGQFLAEIYAQLPRAIRHGILRPLFKRLPDTFSYNTRAAKLRWLDNVADHSGFERYADSAAYLRFPHAMKARLFTDESWRGLGNGTSEELLREFFEDGSASAFIDKMLHADCRTRLAEHQLPIVDRMSMAHSLELRSPFLDRRIVEFAQHIPAALKLKKQRLKYVTRRLAERYLSRGLAYRPKQGFGFPLALWLRGPLRGLMQRVIDESRVVETGLFRREEMQRLHDEHVSGRIDHYFRLWMIFNIELFWRRYFGEESVESLEAWISAALSDASNGEPVTAEAISSEDGQIRKPVP